MMLHRTDCEKHTEIQKIWMIII